MSIAAIDWALKQDIKPVARKFILVALANAKNDTTGLCCPGQKFLAQVSGLSIREVRRHLDALEESGLISRERRFRENGSKTSDNFALSIDTRKVSLADTGDLWSPMTSGHPCPSPADTGVRSITGRVIGRYKRSDRAREEGAPGRLESDRRLSIQSAGENPTALTLVSDRPSGPSAVPDYPPDFEQLWAAYPKRLGANSKKAAFRAYKARLKSGADPVKLLRAVENYARDARDRDKVGTEFVKMASSFLGPDEHWREWADKPVTSLTTTPLIRPPVPKPPPREETVEEFQHRKEEETRRLLAKGEERRARLAAKAHRLAALHAQRLVAEAANEIAKVERVVQ